MLIEKPPDANGEFIKRSKRMLKTGLAKYRMLLSELVKRDIKIKYKGSILGIVWSVLSPLLMMLVMAAVFSLIFHFDIPHYVVYLLTGQVFFSFMVEATTLSMQSILGNGSLLRKVYVPKYIFPLSKIISTMVNLAFIMVAVFIVMAIDGVPFSWSLLMIPVAVFYLFLFTLGLGLLLAAAVVFFRDIAHIYGVFVTAWMYFTPIFYRVDLIPPQYQIIFKLNPMYHYVSYFRMIILEGRVPPLEFNAVCLGIGIVMLFLGAAFFKAKQYKFLNYV
ncbi:MAG: ABC transporter permease [Bacillota bacterium]|nr:ABC transporter permease [Bacillota bacterium]